MRVLAAASRAAGAAPANGRSDAGPLAPLIERSRPWLLPIALLVLWQAATASGLFPPNLVPSPAAVLAELVDLALDGDLTEHLWVTSWRVAAGFVAGTAAATVLGAICGYWRPLRDLLDPTLQALKAVPSLAWVPLFILWFGIFEASKVTLIAVGVFFPVYLNLMSGIQGVDRKLVEVGRAYGLSRTQLVGRILLPATLPAYIAGLRGGLALGWMFVIAAELMGASSGLGYLMIDGQMTGNPAVIVGSLILFAIVGKLSDALLAGVGNRLLAWQDTVDARPEADAHARA
ncbi:ABC transporter permease [Marinivivus vitaminiproducens]|uniref:ABC transporter permease n=1 Tax=Marinivivus vitaminiproducens TaxID=3035935 RepID=UPI0027980D91|nr:ABC transporter permease [Geminicoccaceae bacterium SCSIO 64248]